MPYKNLISLLAVVLTFVGFYPYIISILRGKIKPHVFSWIIWGITTIIAFLAQYQDNGGAGSIPMGISGIITLFIAFLAYSKRADISVHLLDWLFLFLALISLPFWYFTSDPLWAVVILTIVDTLGFGPTVRKAYNYPFEEDILFYSLFTIRNVLSIVALENYSLTTILFPVVIALSCFALVLLVLYRRSKLKSII